MSVNPLDNLMRNVIPIAYDDSLSYYELVAKIVAVMNEYIATSTITYADPIQWDITSQYPKNTVVITVNGDGYLSVQAVPVGVDIDNTDYWTKIGNFSELWGSIKLSITSVDEKLLTTASAARAVNDLVWLNNDLYVIISPMEAGTRYIEGTNCLRTTIDARLSDLFKEIDTTNSNLSEQIKSMSDKITALQSGKIDKTTTGNLVQGVAGKYTLDAKSLQVYLDGDAQKQIARSQATSDGYAIDIANTDADVYAYAKNLNLNVKNRLNIVNPAAQTFDSNFDYLPIYVNGVAKKAALLKDSAAFVSGSPHSIEEFQTLKKDGTDDITATLNTYTKQFPLSIPVGTYKISAPVQLKHSLFGSGSSRDPQRGTSDTILQYTDNPTSFGTLGVLTVSGDDVSGNIVIANLDIICNGMIGGIVFRTNKYTDNSIYNVSIAKVKSYGVYLNPDNSTLNRYCYMDNVCVWGFSDNTPKERWDSSCAFYWGSRSPDCECNNLLAMVCQTGFDCRTNVYGCNWTVYCGIPYNGAGGADANTWWENSCGLKVTANDVHVTNLYLDTMRRGIIFDGPGKAAAYISNLIYACNDGTASSATTYACLALIGSSPNPQLVVEGGVFNRTAKVSTMIQSTGTYPVKNMACTMNGVYIYADRNVIFPSSGQQVCLSGEHKLIDSAITDRKTYYVPGQTVSGDPEQYKAFAYIPLANGGITSQGTITVRDRNNQDLTIFVGNDVVGGSLFQIAAFNNRTFAAYVYNHAVGSVTPTYNVETPDTLYYTADNNVMILYLKRPASYDYTVTVDGFNQANSPVILDCLRNTDGTPMDYPRWPNNNGMTPIKQFVVRM